MAKELTEPVRLCDAEGRLNPAAVGWARRPLWDCNLSGSWPRKKRWEYWCVTSDTHLIALTYADVDYLGFADLWFLDLETQRTHHHPVAVPLALGFALPRHVGENSVHLRRLGLELTIRDDGAGTRLAFVSRKLGGHRLQGEIFVDLPRDHETLNVVVPWDTRRFQFTSKHQCRPARGFVRTSWGEFRFTGDNQAFGCLDFGRGVWPYRTAWNWASASGHQAGRTIGLNLGGKWTDTSPTNENGVVSDGRLHKILERVEFRYDPGDFMRPWELATESGSVALRFSPVYERSNAIELGLLSSSVHQCFGHFSGKIVAGDQAVVIHRLFGWAEEHRARW